MAKLKLGASGLLFPPIEVGVDAVKGYEAAGIDFVCYWDQLNLTIPRSIWTPDICPAAELWHIDTWMDGWTAMSAAAMATDSIEFMIVNDGMRRPPSITAQMALTLSHITKGRFFLVMGAGEAKQFTPYGLARPKPFAHLEEALKIIRMFFESSEPIDYDGPIWKLQNAVVGLDPYQGAPPTMMVAGGPGKAMQFGATLADGWMTYLPPCASPEQYAEEIAEFKRCGEAAGKDPDQLNVLGCMAVFVCPTDAAVAEAAKNPAARWDSAAIMPSGNAYRAATGRDNPLGPEWSYPRDLIPMDIPREDALDKIKDVPPEVVYQTRFAGTPEQAAAQMQPYIDAGITHLACLNCADLVLSGDYGDAMSQNNVMNELFGHVRAANPAGSAAAAVVGS